MDWTTVRREEVGSTNDLARELLGSGAAVPLLVRAARQTRGRGRGANAWWSDAGSLTFSLAVDPAAVGLTPSHEPKLALATAVAVIEAAAAVLPMAPPLGIRWPNDIEAGGRKLGGILPERVQTPDGVRLIVGIGLNLTTDLRLAPTEVRRMATTLGELAGDGTGQCDPEALLKTIVERFGRVLSALASGDPALSARWAELDTLRGEPVRVDLGTGIVAGIGHGIDPEGALAVAAEGGVVRLFGGRVLRTTR